jgi:hypothetical protein
MRYLKLWKAILTLGLIIMTYIVIYCGKSSLSPIELPLSVGVTVSGEETTKIMLIMRKSSNRSYTSYDVYGSPEKTVQLFNYDPEGKIKKSLETAGFKLVKEESTEREHGTAFVNYRERTGFGKDAGTTFFFSYTFFHRTGGKIIESEPKTSGFKSLEELKAVPGFQDFGKVLKEALSKGIRPQNVKVGLSIPKPSFKPTLVKRVTEDIKNVQLFTFSADGRTVAYVGKKEGKNVIMKGETIVDKFDAIIDRLVFHPNGTTLGYIIKRNGACFAAIDGKKGYAYVSVSGFCFSPDGRKYGYIAQRGKKKFVVINGKEGPKFDRIRTMVSFSKRGDWAYWGVDGKQLMLVVNGVKKATEWDEITTPVFTPDGNVSFAGKKEKKWFLVSSEREELLNIDGDILAGPFFSPKGDKYNLVVRRGNEWFVISDGKEGRKFWRNIGIPVLSNDRRHLAFRVRGYNVASVVVDDMESEIYDEVLGPIRFSPDGQSISFGARKGRELYLEVIEIAELKAKQRSKAIGSVLGTRWLLVRDGGESKIELMDKGILHSPSSTNSTWEQDGEIVRFYFNKKYASYKGRLISNQILVGTAHNVAGKSWEWKATKLK